MSSCHPPEKRFWETKTIRTKHRKQNQPASNAHFVQTRQNHQTPGEDSVPGKMALGPQPQKSRRSAEWNWLGSKSFSSFSLNNSLLICNSVSLWFNVFLAALSPACRPPFKKVLENRHVGNQKCPDNLIRTMGIQVFSQKTEQLRSREGFIRRENGLGKRLGSKHMGCIYFCKMEATASVTPGATIGMPVIACQYPAKSAWVTWIVHHALRSSQWRFWGKNGKTIANPPAKQITRTREFQKRSSWAIVAISLAFAMILLGGAFWSDPYRPMKASMAFPFRLADANLCS